MIKRITSADAAGVVEKFLSDDRLAPPVLADEPLAEYLARLERAGEHILGHYSGGVLTDAFVFIIDANNRYYEAVWALSEDKNAVVEAVRYLKDNYPDFSGDWVFNPRNTVAVNALKALGAEVIESLRGYILDTPRKYECANNIRPLEEKHHAEYAAMHSKDVYWTAERVIASDKFAVWTALDGGHITGYIDLFRDAALSEVYDWQAADSDIKEALMSAAISEARSPVLMMLEDGADADILEKIGFVRVPKRDNITLQLELNTLTEVLL